MTSLFAQLRQPRGSALVELAIALPVLLLVFFGTVDFARVIYLGIALNNAARAGAQYGAQSLISSVDTAGIQATADAASPTIGAFTATVSTPSCFCATDSAALTASSCTATCASGQHLAVFVTVTTSATFARVTPFPGIPATVPLVRAARMRVAY